MNEEENEERRGEMMNEEENDERRNEAEKR